jgi:hypothetical protein
MIELTYLFGAVAVLAGALSSVSVWAPRRLAVKLLALSGAALFLPTAYAGFAQLLALPKPVALEWWQANAEEATVLAASLREDEAIYVWLQLKDVVEPRAYALPCSRLPSARPRKPRRRCRCACRSKTRWTSASRNSTRCPSPRCLPRI